MTRKTQEFVKLSLQHVVYALRTTLISNWLPTAAVKNIETAKSFATARFESLLNEVNNHTIFVCTVIENLCNGYIFYVVDTESLHGCRLSYKYLALISLHNSIKGGQNRSGKHRQRTTERLN